jgi:hypothetical protein
MKLNKPAVLFLLLALVWSMLLSACNSNPAAGSPSSNRHTSPTASGSTGTSATLAPDCPAAGSARAAHMPADTTTAQPAVFYLTGREIGKGVQAPLDLKRYDLVTGETSTISSFPQPSEQVPVPALSPDKHWLLLTNQIHPQNNINTSRLLLMRADGTQVQTLTCLDVAPWSRLIWSPDGQQVAFLGLPMGQGWQATIFVLNLPTGHEKRYLANTDYAPDAWLDNQRLYVSQDTGNDQRTLSLLDTSKGNNQKPGDLTPIASTSPACSDYTLSADRQKVYGATCSPVLPTCGQGMIFHGPAGLNERPATGGSSKSLLSRQNLAMVAMQAIDSQTLLLYILDSNTGFPQNGLWEMNTQTGALQHLVPTTGSCSGGEMLSLDEMPQIASNGLSYVVRVTNWVSSTRTEKQERQTLQVGSISGGAPSTVVTIGDMQQCGCGLTLVGMA